MGIKKPRCTLTNQPLPLLLLLLYPKLLLLQRKTTTVKPAPAKAPMLALYVVQQDKPKSGQHTSAGP